MRTAQFAAHRSPAPTTAIVSLNHVTMAFPSTDQRGVMQAFDA